MPRAPIRKYDAEDVFQLLNYDQELTLDHLAIRKQSAVEEAEEPGPGPQPNDRTMTGL